MNRINAQERTDYKNLLTSFNNNFLINNKEITCKVDIFDITNGYSAKLYECFFYFYSDITEKFESIFNLNGVEISLPRHKDINNIKEGRNVLRVLTQNFTDLKYHNHEI